MTEQLFPRDGIHSIPDIPRDLSTLPLVDVYCSSVTFLPGGLFLAQDIYFLYCGCIANSLCSLAFTTYFTHLKPDLETDSNLLDPTFHSVDSHSFSAAFMFFIPQQCNFINQFYSIYP